MADSPDFFTARKEFHLREYESLKKEIFDLVEHSRKLEVYAVAAIAGFYAWFLHESSTSRVYEALYIPILLALLGGFRSIAVLKRVYDIATYLRDLEARLALRDLGLVGWETYRHRPNITSNPFLSSSAVFWLVLLVISVVAWRLLKEG